MNLNIQEVRTENFETEILQSPIPVLLHFSAQWAGPCRRMKPVLARMAEEMKGKMAFAEVDIDDSSTLAIQYQIRGLPVFALFREGKVIGIHMGVLPEAKLKEWIKENIREADEVKATGQPRRPPNTGFWSREIYNFRPAIS